METTFAKKSRVATKFQAGVAACAIATAAALTPAVAAQADIAPAPLAPVTDIVTAPVYGSLDIAQDLPFWILENKNDPTPIFTFTPLGLVPVFLQSAYKALTANLDFSVNLGFVVLKVGSYGTFTISRGF